MTTTRYWLSLSNFEVNLVLRSEKEFILVGGYPKIVSKTKAYLLIAIPIDTKETKSRLIKGEGDEHGRAATNMLDERHPRYQIHEERSQGPGAHTRPTVNHLGPDPYNVEAGTKEMTKT